MSEASLEDILSGEVPEIEPEPEVEVEAEQEEPTGEVEAEAETEAEPPSAESEPEKPPSNFVPQAALADERAKRQEAQRELDDLRLKLKQPEPKAEEPETPIDFLDDPDGYMAQREKAFEAKLRQVEQSSNARFLTLCENAAKARHEDYDDVAAAFGQAAQANPALAAEAMQSADPAEYVYKAGKRLKMLADAGGDLESLIEQEKQKAVAAALAAQAPSATERAADIPESLSKVTGATTREDKAPEDVPLESLFNNY